MGTSVRAVRQQFRERIQEKVKPQKGATILDSARRGADSGDLFARSGTVPDTPFCSGGEKDFQAHWLNVGRMRAGSAFAALQRGRRATWQVRASRVIGLLGKLAENFYRLRPVGTFA